MMKKTEIEINGTAAVLYEPVRGTPRALLIQPADKQELSLMDREMDEILALDRSTEIDEKEFALAVFSVRSWNEDLSPWTAPPVFGKEGFGSGASGTLRFVLEDLCGFLKQRSAQYRDIPVFIGGYSLAGLFSLWAVHSSEGFAGAAAVSPSVWFPGWTGYAETHPCLAQHVYLSLGDKEEKTRSKAMAQVGKAIRREEEILREQGTDCILEWNPGNHFCDPEKRTAKGFSWLLERNGISC